MPKEEGQFKKGNPGRKEGSKNKLTTTVKDAFLNVFNELQQDDKHNLVEFAKKYPRDFYALSTKLIPTEVAGGFKFTGFKITVGGRED